MSPSVLTVLAALEPFAVYLPFCFFSVLGVIIVGELGRYRIHRRRLGRLRAIGVDGDPSSDAELQTYLHPSRSRVDIDGDRRFLLRVSRREMLGALSGGFRSGGLGGAFTGIALFLTFVLIGLVLATHMQSALTSFSGSGARVGPEAQEALAEASESLAHAVGGLGSKFFISAAGIFCTVAYSLFAVHLRTRHDSLLDETELDLRRVLASPNEYEGLLQRRHLDVLSEISTKIERLSSIEVSVQNLSTEVAHQLSQVLSEDLGKQMKDMMGQALERVDAIAAQANETFSADLQKAMGAAQQGMPRILDGLDAIRQAVTQQATSPVEELLNKFQTAVTGGYQQETAELSATLRQFATTVPEMVRSLEAAGRHVTETVTIEQARGQAMQQQVFSDITQLVKGLERQQSAMGELVGRIQGEALAAATSLGSQLQEQMGTAASGFAEVTATQTLAMNERFAAVLSNQQSAFAELETRVGVIVGALGQADRALASSARHLEASAQQLGVAQAANDKVVGGAMRVVVALRGSADALNQHTTNSQAFLEQAKRIVHEAMEQADREAELTRQLQAVWPGLLDKYLQSFQQKSDALASSWTGLHKQVESLASGVVDRLQDPVEELRDTVNTLEKALRAGGSR